MLLKNIGIIYASVKKPPVAGGFKGMVVNMNVTLEF
jgi:hypothetical protein